jgi:hypothetical protein
VVALEVVVAVVVVVVAGDGDATGKELAAAAALGGPPVARCRSDEAALASVDDWWVGTAAAGKSEARPEGCAGNQAGFGGDGSDDDADAGDGDGDGVVADEIRGGKSDMSEKRPPYGATDGVEVKRPWSWPGWAASFTRTVGLLLVAAVVVLWRWN